MIARILRHLATLANVAANLAEGKAPTDHVESRFREIEHEIQHLHENVPAWGAPRPDDRCLTCDCTGSVVLVCGRKIGHYDHGVLRCTYCGATWLGPGREVPS